MNTNPTNRHLQQILKRVLRPITTIRQPILNQFNNHTLLITKNSVNTPNTRKTMQLPPRFTRKHEQQRFDTRRKTLTTNKPQQTFTHPKKPNRPIIQTEQAQFH